MRIGVIGIGDIARKAYLPITTRIRNVELFVFTRNKETRIEIKDEYKHINILESLDELLELEVDAVMIHSATDSHFQLCKSFLNKGIPVFVDKPISMHLDEVEELFTLAKGNDVLFRTGFNRRYSPFVKQAFKLGTPDVLIYQKNRFMQPGELNSYIFDDFIHVIDTSRFLMQEVIKDIRINHLHNDDGSYSINVFMQGNKVSCNALMYRKSGRTEEKIEIFWPNKKIIINDLDSQIDYSNNIETHIKSNNWSETLVRRGFTNMINEFIDDVKKGSKYNNSDDDSFQTHKLCSEIYLSIIDKKQTKYNRKS